MKKLQKALSMTGLAIALVAAGMIFVAPVLDGRASAACSGQDTSRGTVTLSVNTPVEATYRFWARVKAASSADNSFILEVDGSTCNVIVGDSSSISTSSWTWVNYKDGNTSAPIDLTLGAGNHSFLLIGREDSVQVDRIILTNDVNCVPSGTGDNCSGSGTDSSGSQSGSGSSATSGGATLGSGAGSTVTIKASNSPVNVASGTDVVVAPAVSPSDFAEVSKVEYYLDGKLVATEDAAPFTYKVDTAKLKSGSHTLTSKVYYKDGTTKSTTQTLNIKPVAKKSKGGQALASVSIFAFLLVLIGSYLYIHRRIEIAHHHPAPAADIDTLPQANLQEDSERFQQQVAETQQVPGKTISPTNHDPNAP